MRQIPVVEKTAKKNDVPDISCDIELSAGIREDIDR